MKHETPQSTKVRFRFGDIFNFTSPQQSCSPFLRVITIEGKSLMHTSPTYVRDMISMQVNSSRIACKHQIHMINKSTATSQDPLEMSGVRKFSRKIPGPKFHSGQCVFHIGTCLYVFMMPCCHILVFHVIHAYISFTYLVDTWNISMRSSIHEWVAA